MSEQLAIHGGQPTIPEGTIKPWPHITDADRQAVMEVLSSDSINEQRKIQSEALSQEWAAYVGRKYCIPTNSGTAALHMCIAALGIEPGDEVIVPAFTFWATAAAVLHHNAIPIFVDIDPKTYCIDPAQIEAKLSERTKAVIAVHIHGMPADMDGVLAVAKQHGLKIIEDAAQAHGSRYKGVPCGAIGDVAGFSTQMSKTLTTGSEGGLFVTDDENYHKQAALLQYFGELVVPGRERQEQEYNAFGLGWMYRGDVFGQAFIRSQLKRLDTNNALRIRNCNFLTEHLSKIKGIETPYVPPQCESVFYNYVVGVKPDELGLSVSPRVFREKIQEALAAEGLHVGQWQRRPVPAQEIFQARIGYGRGCPWTCGHAQPVEYRTEDYPNATAFIDSHFYLFDVNPPNDLDLMKLYVEAFEKVMDNPDQLVE
ncbi:DegT/DnrJ/EryC1/StrS family aminotransferase [Candidatus Poribacteria bacterium]|nr:MAG: DegT/DnrJ/EryC1/StrS family aminotransferase [Candidatus Poribacteria bacterium]